MDACVPEWEDSDVEDAFIPDEADQDEEVEQGILRSSSRDQQKKQVRFSSKVPAAAGKKPARSAWRGSSRARACQRQEERTLKASMALEKLELDMMVLDPSGLPVGGTPPCPGPLAASLLESASSQPAVPPILTPQTSSAAPVVRSGSSGSSSSGWLEDANNMAVERLLPSGLRQLSLGVSKPVSFQAAAAYVRTVGALSMALRPSTPPPAVVGDAAQPSSAAAEGGLPCPAPDIAAPQAAAAAEPSAAAPGLVPTLSLSAKAGKSYMGLSARSREEWQALAVQDPAQVEGLVAEAVTAANTVMVRLHNMDTEVRALLGADSCWQSLPRDVDLLRRGLNEGKALNQDLRQLLVAVLALQAPQQQQGAGHMAGAAGTPQGLGGRLLQHLERAALELLGALKQLAGAVFLSCRRGLCEVKDEWDTAASSSGVAEAMRVCFHESQQLIRLLVGLEDRCRLNWYAWSAVPAAASSYWAAAEKVTQWVDIVMVGIRDATLGMQKRVLQPPGWVTAADAAALQPQRQELLRAWQASGQLALMVSKEMSNLQIKALQEQIKLLIWAGDRVREVVQHHEEELRRCSAPAAGGSAAAAGGLPCSREDSGSELLGRPGTLGTPDFRGLLSVPSLTFGTSRQGSELRDTQQAGGSEGGPTAADVAGQDWVSQLLLELVKATMRVHMVLLEVMVARERAQSEEQHPAVNALQKKLLWDLLHRAHHGFFTLAHANLRRVAALAAAPEQLPRSSQAALLRQSWKALLLFKLAGQHHKYCFKAGAILGRSETQELLEGPLDAARSRVTETMFRLRDLLRPPGRIASLAPSSTSDLGSAAAAAAGSSNAARGAAAAGAAAVVAAGTGLGCLNPAAAWARPRALGRLAHELRWVWEEVADDVTRCSNLRFAWQHLTSGLGPAGGAAAEARGDRPPVSRAMSLRRDAKTLGEGSYGKVYLGKLNGAEVAVKVLKLEASLHGFLKEVLPSFRREVELMRRSMSDNVVAYRGCCCELPEELLLCLQQEQQQYLVSITAPGADTSAVMDSSRRGSLQRSGSGSSSCSAASNSVTSGRRVSEPGMLPDVASAASSSSGRSDTELKEQVEMLELMLSEHLQPPACEAQADPEYDTTGDHWHRFSPTASVRLAIVMEKCNLGNLRDMLGAGAMVQSIYRVEAKGNVFSELSVIDRAIRLRGLLAARRLFEEWPLRLQVLKGVAAGIECLHNNGIVHRDLASRNVLLCGSEKMDDWTAKVCDLNLSRCLAGAAAAANTISGLTFSADFAAPERMGPAGTGCGRPADVFSLGVIIWEVVTMQRRDGLSEEDLLEVEEGCPLPPHVAGLPWPPEEAQLWVPAEDAKQLKALAQECWCTDPEQRIRITAVRQKLEEMIAQEAAREGGQAVRQRLHAFKGVLQAKARSMAEEEAAAGPGTPAAVPVQA